jgi:membrane protein YqaA with SNARE-associated domain
MTDEVMSQRPGVVRRMYNWVLGWADTPYGGPALFVLAFAESSFFPIPPDVLLIALAVAAPTRAWRFALICTVGSVLGGIAGYAIGVWAYPAIGQPLVDLYHGQAVMDKIAGLYAEHGFWGILIAAITPIPYKVFTISSGLFGYNFGSFLAASVIGRAFRFFLVATLIKYFGPAVKGWIERNFNWAVTAMTVLLVGGFLLVKVVLGH